MSKKTAESVLKKARAENVPVLVVVAKDKCSLAAVRAYYEECVKQECSNSHVDGVVHIERDFRTFQANNSDKVKLPD